MCWLICDNCNFLDSHACHDSYALLSHFISLLDFQFKFLDLMIFLLCGAAENLSSWQIDLVGLICTTGRLASRPSEIEAKHTHSSTLQSLHPPLADYYTGMLKPGFWL